MILFFPFVFLIKSLEDCEIDDYFCLYLNKIENRWFHPQNNLTNDFANEIINLTNKVEKFSISKNNQSNTSFIIENNQSIDVDLRSTFIRSKLISRTDEQGKKEVLPFYWIFVKIFTKGVYSINRDFDNGWKIDGRKGNLTFELDSRQREVNMSKIIMNNFMNLNCSIKQFNLYTFKNSQWNKIAAFNLSKSVRGVQEFLIPTDQNTPVFRIEVTDNFEDSFTCFNQPLAFKY